MEFDKKPNIIKYQGSKLQVMQNLTDDLAEKMGKSKFNWKNINLEKQISLAEVFDELTKNLNTLGEDYDNATCSQYYISDNGSNIRTNTTYSSNNGDVCNRNFNGYTFKTTQYTAYHGDDKDCKADQHPGK